MVSVLLTEFARGSGYLKSRAESHKKFDSIFSFEEHIKNICKSSFYHLILILLKSASSSCKEYLAVPRSRLKTYGDKAFSIAGPKLWNNLPLEIRKCASVATFKQSLKTFFI